MRAVRSTFKLLFYINKNKTKADGTMAVLCRITIDGANVVISTGESTNPHDWSVKRGETTDKKTNQRLQTFREEIEQRNNTLLYKYGAVSAELLKNHLQGIGRTPTTLLALSAEGLKSQRESKGDVAKLLAFPLQEEGVELSRRMFLFSVFTGLAFADLQILRASQIEINNEGKRDIRKARQETEVESLIPLHPIVEQALSLYTKEDSKEDYKIFPDTMSKGKLSTHLKAVGLARGIRTPLAWQIARHSFGTLTLEAGIPIESIAKMMGHSTIVNTQIYAQITDQKIARDMERLMDINTL